MRGWGEGGPSKQLNLASLDPPRHPKPSAVLPTPALPSLIACSVFSDEVKHAARPCMYTLTHAKARMLALTASMRGLFFPVFIHNFNIGDPVLVTPNLFSFRLVDPKIKNLGHNTGCFSLLSVGRFFSLFPCRV